MEPQEPEYQPIPQEVPQATPEAPQMPPVAPQPVQYYTPPSRPPKKWGIEVLKFLGLFVLFFSVITLIVMGPTIYAKLSYTFGGGDKATNKYDLPSTVGTDDSSISSLVTQVDNSSKFPGVDSIIIPKIGAEAPIVYAESQDNKLIMDDLQKGVVHYNGTALPGHFGNTFITGHSSYYWWSGGKYNQVFALLDKLRPGDVVYINTKEGKYIYRVKESFVVSPTQTDVLNPTDTPILTLMTCTPIGTNLRRLIVRAELVGRPPVLPSDFKEFSNIPKLPTFLPVY